MTAMQKIRNVKDQLFGKGKKRLGEATDNEQWEVEGHLKEAGGDLKQAGQKVKDAFDK